MKVLVIHTYYNLRGGEDSVFEQEVALLQRFCNVRVLTFKNLSGTAGLKQFLFQEYNKESNKSVTREIEIFKPDIIHIHNLHFAGGWGLIPVIKSFNIPLIMTLHNYRLLCPSGVLYHDGNLFLDSLSQGFPWKAVKKKVYRNSILLTFWLARTLHRIQRFKVLNLVDRYIVLTEFAKDLFVTSNLGIAEEKFQVKPNCVSPTNDEHSITREKHFLFIGRLSEEKGLDVLLESFKNTNSLVYIAGSGPMEEKVIEYADKYNSNFVFLGRLNADEIRVEMQKATALIFPSLWYEGMPLTIIEAFASGLPVIASKIGAMESMINHGYNGIHFNVSDREDLLNAVNQWESMPEDSKRAYSRNAYETYLHDYTIEKNLQMMKELYKTLLHENTSAYK